MEKYKQFDFIEIVEFEKDLLAIPKHGQNYFELMYILKGQGIHYLNNNRIAYDEGDVFVVSLEDEHQFDVIEPSSFLAIKFTDAYFTYWEKRGNGRVRLALDKIMRSRALKETKLELTKINKDLLRQTIENIRNYAPRYKISTSSYVFYQLLSVFGLIEECLGSTVDGYFGKESMLSFIHQHIYFPEKLKTKYLANRFNIAESYFGTYFKRSYGMNIREYISDYKITLIKNRIKNHQSTLKQIAIEFGFNDESHLSHFFKNKTGILPSAFIATIKA